MDSLEIYTNFFSKYVPNYMIQRENVKIEIFFLLSNFLSVIQTLHFKNLFQLKKMCLLAYHSHSSNHELTIPSMNGHVTKGMIAYKYEALISKVVF